MMDHQGRTSRRNVLAFLGLATTATPALQTEAMALDQPRRGEGHHPQMANCVSLRACAHALRQLADGLESGRVIPEGLEVKSSLVKQDWLEQELRFAFYLTDDGKESPVNQKDGFEWLDQKEARKVLEEILCHRLSGNLQSKEFARDVLWDLDQKGLEIGKRA